MISQRTAPRLRAAALLASALAALLPAGVQAQTRPSTSVSDTVAAPPSTRYEAGTLRRFLFGDNYRYEWGQPVRAPVLDLRSFAGGIVPYKEGGSGQTKSVRFLTRDSVEYVFRVIDKDKQSGPPEYEGSVVEWIFRDQVSAMHPASAVLAAPLVESGRVLHVWPAIVVMPNDTLLGKFREAYAGRLGIIEEYPAKREDAPGFAGAFEVMDDEKLLEILNSDPTQRIDARAYLTARLIDLLIGDSDRHKGNWRWAEMPRQRGVWLPVPRDRDKTMISYGGLIPAIARPMVPRLVTFDSTYANLRGITWNAFETDGRLLGSLEKPVWDSIAVFVVRQVTDSTIDAAMRAMPAEFQGRAADLAGKLRARRAWLPDLANRYYAWLSEMVDVHGTDTADVATIRRLSDGSVEVQLASGGRAPYFARRFDARETSEIRIHLHGGDDHAVVSGHAGESITVRVAGGNGTNRMVDSSTVGGRSGPTHFYDLGSVEGVDYGKDSIFNRQPWEKRDGELVRWGPNYGGKLTPLVGLTQRRGLGLTPKLGVSKVEYGFRRWPYKSLLQLEAEYSTAIDAYRIGLLADERFEESRLHIATAARMSEFEVLKFYGFGNDTDGDDAAAAAGFFDVRQRQWMFHPALALALGFRSDISIGPVVQYVTTDSVADRFVSEERPYGFAAFGQAGARLAAKHERRNLFDNPDDRLELSLTTSVYPALWDVASTYGDLGATFGASVTLPLPLRPVLVVRGGGKKLYGDFPFHEAAFIGGHKTTRFMSSQRYAGDAALYGTTELRIPLVGWQFPMPMQAGVIGIADAGRVWVDGASPGGWHTVAGGGLWIGLRDPQYSVNFMYTNELGRSGLRVKTGLSF